MVVAVHGLDTLVGGEVPQLDGHVSATGHCTEGKATVTPSVTTMCDCIHWGRRFRLIDELLSLVSNLYSLPLSHKVKFNSRDEQLPSLIPSLHLVTML